jgi:translation initiation factor IF-3
VNLSTKNRYRINFQIKVPQVRVSFDNQQLGIMPTDHARNLAYEKGLDLIEIVPNANPPICCIADFGKLKYEAKIKEKAQAKKQREAVQQLKEIRFTPTIAEHDIEYKCKNIEKFLLEGKKVSLMMKFSPRELNHKDIGFATINAILSRFEQEAVVEVMPRFNGRMLSCVLSPKSK